MTRAEEQGQGAEPRKPPSAAITAAATTVVAEAITAAHGELDRKGQLSPTTERKTTKPSGPASEAKGGETAADTPGNGAAVGGPPASADWQLGASPRPIKPGGDLRGSFLAAVGNTISQTEPLGIPKINPDASSSSSGEDSEPPVQIPRRSRRASSITRAGNAALSLSSKSSAAASSVPLEMAPAGPSLPKNENADERLRRIAYEDIDEPVRRLLLASPAYPGGVGGRLYKASSAPADGSGSGDAGKQPRKCYRLVFDGGQDDPRREEKAATAAAAARAGAAGLPLGLEAVPDENDPTVLCVRELGPVGTGAGGSGGDGGGRGVGCVVARIRASPAAAGGRESIHSVSLEPGKGMGRKQQGGEIMAVRVSTHPTRLAAPREVRAVLLLPPRGGGGQEKSNDIKTGGVSVWDTTDASRADGLWEAAAAGRVAEGVTELQSKPAAWSSTTKSFELDLLEAWRPGKVRPGEPKEEAEGGGFSASSQPAPETMQMVLGREGDGSNGSARSGGGSSARSVGGSRIPTMQLARVRGTENSSSPGSSAGGGNQGAGEHSWMMAIAAPMPPLHGFCLAVVGLETAMVGATVTLVDRSAATAKEEEAAGFLGFDKALTQDGGSGRTLSARGKETPPASARIQQQQQQQQPQGGGQDETNTNGGQGSSGSSSVPSVPALALAVVAPPAGRAATKSGRSAPSTSRRPSSRRSGGGDKEQNDPTSADQSSSVTRTGNDDGGEKSTLSGANQRAGVDRESEQDKTQQKSGALSRGATTDDRGAVAGIGANGPVGGGGRSGGQGAAGGTVPVPVKRRMSVQVVAAKIVDKVYRNTYVCNLCLLTLTVSFAADLYPGAPSHNVPMSAALLWACSNVDDVRALRRRSFAYALSVVVLVSLFMDVDFLASDLKAYALTQLEEEDDDLQRVILEKNMRTFGRIIVGIVAGLKALSWQGLLATCPQGVHALNLLWRRFKLFLPVWGSPRKLTKEVYNRVVALAWLHLLASVALAVMAGIAGMGFEWAPQFASSQGAGIPLAAVCFLKSLTNMLVSAALFRNMDLALCLNVFGCLACFQGWHRAREERRRARHGVTYPKVILEWDYIMLCAYIKMFDLLVGLWLWIGLGWSWSEDRDYSERHNVRMLLAAVTTVQTLTDVWSVFLGITVSLLVSQYLLRKEKSAAAALNAFGDGGGDKDVEIARSLSTGRLLASPPMSPDSSSSIEGGGGKGRARRDDTESSDDDDSYSTGESDTGSSGDEAPPRRRGTASGIDIQLGASTTPAAAVVDTQPTQGAWPPPSSAPVAPNPAPRRRSMFAPGGNRLVYKRAFSARSSSDDSAVGGGDTDIGGGRPPPPEAISLDRSFNTSAEEFTSAWESLRTCASFRCRIGRLPGVETLASHLREQGFVVVASGVVADGLTKIYTCARGVGVEALFFAELVFEKEMHELAFTFKCQDDRLTPRFVCHMHLRRVIGDHQPIA